MPTFEEKVLNDLKNGFSEADAEWASQMPRGMVLAKRHYAAVARLRATHPNLIIVNGLDALGDYLRHHIWCKQDILNVFPWKNVLFTRLLGKKLPFILNTEIVRMKYKDVFKDWPLIRVNAQNLYAPSDLLEWFRFNLKSTVETVMVPLTMFAFDADAMRDVYKRVRDAHLTECYKQKKHLKLREMRLCCWPEIQACIRPEFKDDIGKLFEDKTRHAKEQGCVPRRAKLPPYEVTLPADKMPFFCESSEIAGVTRNGYQSVEVSLTSFRDFAWAKHEIRPEAAEDGAPVSRAGYTQGLCFGGKETIKDYEMGLVEVMTAERFVNMFGEDALKKADWRFSKDLCAWAKPDAAFGPGLPPKEMGILLGANLIAPKERLP